MHYNDYIKQKIINIYLVNQNIGNSKFNLNFFDILDKYEFTPNSNETISDISDTNFQKLVKEISNSPSLRNNIGNDFLERLYDLKNSGIANFFKNIPLNAINIIPEHKSIIETTYKKLSITYGLKEFYYSLDNDISSEENLNKALALCKKAQIELGKIQKSLSIKDPYKVGNGLLSIQVNCANISSNEAYYSYSNHTISLKDENSTFPLVHEYIHFLDKTTASLLLTGKTTQELYEKNLFSKDDLFYKFDMSVFSKIKYKKNPLEWYEQLLLKTIFSNEIQQNIIIQKLFNDYDANNNYQNQFKNILLKWAEEKNITNKIQITDEITGILNSQTLSYTLKTNYKYTNDEKTILNACVQYNSFNLKKNNVINWSKFLDQERGQNYYITQKEMLARTLEKIINGKLHTLSDTLSTHEFLDKDKKIFLNIIKDWHNICCQIINIENKEEVSKRIEKIHKNIHTNYSLSNKIIRN